jgi:CHAD domain-containing protein
MLGPSQWQCRAVLKQAICCWADPRARVTYAQQYWRYRLRLSIKQLLYPAGYWHRGAGHLTVVDSGIKEDFAVQLQ